MFCLWILLLSREYVPINLSVNWTWLFVYSTIYRHFLYTYIFVFELCLMFINDAVRLFGNWIWRMMMVDNEWEIGIYFRNVDKYGSGLFTGWNVNVLSLIKSRYFLLIEWTKFFLTFVFILFYLFQKIMKSHELNAICGNINQIESRERLLQR